MKTNQDIPEKKWELIAKSIFDENFEDSTEKQVDSLEDLLTDETERKQLLKMSGQIDLYHDLKKFPAEAGWEKVEKQIHRKKSSKSGSLNINYLYRIAAAIFIAALLTFAGYEVYYKSSGAVVMKEISSSDQILNKITLPDGTLVSLNSGTKLSYPEKFVGNTREVTIEGEGFFEVTPDKSKPFIIHAGLAQVKVLGTSFNVNAYPHSEQLEVVVETGRVQVSDQASKAIKSNEMILTPGEKGTLVYSNHLLLKTTNENQNYLAWKTRILTFKASSLSEVIGELQKVYRVDISLAEPKLGDLLLTAQFNDYSLDFILKIIENTFQIEVKNENGQYILTERI